jgi:hypothetical protein
MILSTKVQVLLLLAPGGRKYQKRKLCSESTHMPMMMIRSSWVTYNKLLFALKLFNVVILHVYNNLLWLKFSRCANERSTAVELSTHDSSFEGSNPDAGRDNIAKSFFSVLPMMMVRSSCVSL